MGVKVLIVVLLQQFGAFTTAEKYSDIYPDVSGCFEGTNLKPPELVVNWLLEAKEMCTKLENVDEPSLCYKVCNLQERSIMSYDYKLYEINSAELLGLYSEEKSESVQKKLAQARERLKECDESHAKIPKFEECKNMDPKHHESMQKMVTCIEDAVKC